MSEDMRFDLLDPSGVSRCGYLKMLYQGWYLLAEEDAEKSHQRNHGWCR
jgi:hypothetical protein